MNSVTGNELREIRNRQRTIVEGFFRERVEDWWEDWMKEADRILEDEDLIEAVYGALGRRHPQSATPIHVPYLAHKGRIHLLLLFGKSEQANLSPKQRGLVAQLAAAIRKEAK